MAVTVKNVRDCLNNMGEDEIAEDTVIDKILDAKAWAEESGADPDDGEWGERATKYYAAWLSYIFSNTYLEATAGPISVREAYEQKAALLKEIAENYAGKATGKQVIITKKIPLLREYTSAEQERSPNTRELTR